jgi:predicted dehydrogenase
VVADEAVAYGYEAENRHFVRAFLGKAKPALTFDHGLEVVKLLMTAYRSAEVGRTVRFPAPGLDRFVPKVAKGTWRP